MKREEVFLLRLPLLRLRFRRSEWEAVRRLRVGIANATFVIDVVMVDESTVRGGRRRWLRCPCGRRTSVLGVARSYGDAASRHTGEISFRVGCRVCIPWKSRSESVMSPAAAHATTTLDALIPP